MIASGASAAGKPQIVDPKVTTPVLPAPISNRPELEAFVSPADPVSGILNTADVERAASFDSAVGKSSFTY